MNILKIGDMCSHSSLYFHWQISTDAWSSIYNASIYKFPTFDNVKWIHIQIPIRSGIQPQLPVSQGITRAMTVFLHAVYC